MAATVLGCTAASYNERCRHSRLDHPYKCRSSKGYQKRALEHSAPDIWAGAGANHVLPFDRDAARVGKSLARCSNIHCLGAQLPHICRDRFRFHVLYGILTQRISGLLPEISHNLTGKSAFWMVLRLNVWGVVPLACALFTLMKG